MATPVPDAPAVGPDTRIVGVDGKPVPFERFLELSRAGEVRPEVVRDGHGRFVELRLVPTTPEERARLLAAPAAGGAGAGPATGPTGAPVQGPAGGGLLRLPGPLGGGEQLGRELPDLLGRDLAGESVHASDLAGKVVVLSFWFTACVPCVQEIPQLDAVKARHADDARVVFLAPALDGAEELRSFLARRPLGWRVLPRAGALAEALAVRGYPTNLVVGRDGPVAWAAVGGRSDIGATLDEAIQRALEAPVAAESGPGD
jgi:thiol-disulfide isomerase/thioredoxin